MFKRKRLKKGEKQTRRDPNLIVRGDLILDEISGIRLTGNIIPSSWYSIIGKTMTNGQFKANLLAINILSEVVYWYRLTEVRDEATGFVVERKKKFKADKLQMSYDQMAAKFGQSKIACKRATDELERLGAAIKDLRHIQIENGTKLFNVLFIEPVPEWIKKNSQCLQKSKQVITLMSVGVDEKVNTNTETSSEITTDSNTDSPNGSSSEQVLGDKKNVSRETIKKEPKTRARNPLEIVTADEEEFLKSIESSSGQRLQYMPKTRKQISELLSRYTVQELIRAYVNYSNDEYWEKANWPFGGFFNSIEKFRAVKPKIKPVIVNNFQRQPNEKNLYEVG